MPRPTNLESQKKTTQLTKKPLNLKGSKKRKWRPGTVARREIVKHQRGTEPLVNKSAIRKVVLDAAREAGKGDIRFKKTAVEALREAASSFLVDYFTAANKVRMVENKQKTLQRHHTQIGRATLGTVFCDDTNMPMVLPCSKIIKAEQGKASVGVATLE